MSDQIETDPPTPLSQLHRLIERFLNPTPRWVLVYHALILLASLLIKSRPMQIKDGVIFMHHAGGLLWPESLSLIEQARALGGLRLEATLGFTSALILGITYPTTNDLWSALSPWGLQHILAASGMNVRMFVVISIWMILRPRRHLGWLAPLLALTYFLLTGKDVTVGRAFCMFLISPLVRNTPNSLAIIFLGEAIIYPEHLNSLSYYLSLTALSFVCGYPKLHPWILPIHMSWLVHAWNNSTSWVIYPACMAIGVLVATGFGWLTILLAPITMLIPPVGVWIESLLFEILYHPLRTQWPYRVQISDTWSLLIPLTWMTLLFWIPNRFR